MGRISFSEFGRVTVAEYGLREEFVSGCVEEEEHTRVRARTHTQKQNLSLLKIRDDHLDCTAPVILTVSMALFTSNSIFDTEAERVPGAPGCDAAILFGSGGCLEWKATPFVCESVFMGVRERDGCCEYSLYIQYLCFICSLDNFVCLAHDNLFKLTEGKIAGTASLRTLTLHECVGVELLL